MNNKYDNNNNNNNNNNNDKCPNCKKMREKLAKYQAIIKQLPNLEESRLIEHNNIKMDESILIVDDIDIDYINKHERAAIHAQDRLSNYTKFKTYINKFPIIYNIGYYTITIGKYLLPFL